METRRVGDRAGRGAIGADRSSQIDDADDVARARRDEAAARISPPERGTECDGAWLREVGAITFQRQATSCCTAVRGARCAYLVVDFLCWW